MKNKIKKYNEIYSLDVLEYVSKKNDNLFIVNLLKILNKNRKAKMENFYLDSQTYATKFLKLSPANCISQNNLKIFLNKYLSNVFFMHDEFDYAGYSKMSQYNFMLRCK